MILMLILRNQIINLINLEAALTNLDQDQVGLVGQGNQRILTGQRDLIQVINSKVQTVPTEVL